MLSRFSRSARYLALSALLVAGSFSITATKSVAQDFGTVVPSETTQKSVIAVPTFGTDGTTGLDMDTIPGIIRRDLAITGFFEFPPDQNLINSYNRYDVKNRTVEWEGWRKVGVKYYLMGTVTQPNPNQVDVRILMRDIDSEAVIINKLFSGPANDSRTLAHRISDEVVKFTQFTDGIAQTELLYLTSQIPGVTEVAKVDVDGYDQQILTNYFDNCITPTWGANGTEIYYTTYKGRRARIMGQMLSSGQTWEIAAYGGTSHSPDWNQNRREIVMTLSKDGNSEIYKAQRDGSGLTRLTRTADTEGSPVWSPDSSKIAYVIGSSIYVANSDGSGRKPVISRSSWIDTPAWSPDGQRLAFVSSVSGKNEIFIIDANGNKDSLRRLTQNQGNNESPSWAPNSRHLAFASDRTGRMQIYVTLDDGSNQIQITSSGVNKQPDWGPAPDSE